MPSRVEVTEEPGTKRQKIQQASKTTYLATTRSISSSLKLNLQKHPLNIRPSGNLLISTDEQFARISDSMGIFKKLPDELILKIVSFLHDKKDLQNLMSVSKFFYGFLSNEEIWKSIFLNHQETNPISKWRGSWKNSVLGIDPPSETETHTRINCDTIYSDLVYIPYQNSQVDYEKIFANVIKEERYHQQHSIFQSQDFQSPLDFPIKGRIPRLTESSMTMSEFNTKWHNYPFILQSDKDSPLSSSSPSSQPRWPKWDMPYLLSRFSDVKFREECVDWPLSLYHDYTLNNIDENPLYLFDCNSDAMKQLKTEFMRPTYSQTDHFTKFGTSRPDNTWLIMGPARSGSTFHKDPNSTSAWNATLQGCKLWVMLPPDLKPPGVHTDLEESEVTSPLGLAEWVLSGFYNDSVKLSDETVNKDGFSGCLIGVTFEQDLIHVPSGWWHCVVNITDSVALTANFVPSVKLATVLNFLKNKKNQISGFHPKTFNDVFVKFMEKMESEGKQFFDEDNETVLKNYLKDITSKEPSDFTDEDVGELRNCDIELPTYQFFVELLHQDGMNDELKSALEQMRAIERENNRGNVKKSEVWENLTKEGTDSGFSFGFGFGDDEDDEEDVQEEGDQN
ncbi:unnamed protein product [Ambrosiozyma monospora]|uniref:Unnamed protein product n=1 Tax=Ambrosiozyma monospora TaxID=43982 RepID=A0ACB5SVD1_AMBMO|nr:unnamed protein product [Ambrosiozyma monospora]